MRAATVAWLLCASACGGERPVVVVARASPSSSLATSTLHAPAPVDLTTATIVEARDTATAPNHDVVVRFEKAADGFDWTAKASLYVSVLGERDGDPTYVTWMPCTCDAGEVCACELHDHPMPPPQISRGHVASAPVIAFLNAVAALDASTPAPPRSRRPPYTHRAHASLTVPGATKTTHLTMRDGAWALDEHPLGKTDSLDAAWTALLASIHAPLPPAPSLPTGLEKLPSRAWRVDIDEGDAFIHLKRSGAQFEWTVDAQKGVVASALVEAFIGAVVKHRLAPFGENIEHVPWTDDNPHGTVTVWSPDAPPVVLSYVDQRRRWRVNGLTLALDPGETKAPFHASINAPYHALLGAIDAHVP